MLQAQINELEGRIEAERRKVLTRAFTPSWFVFFKTQKAAALAARAHIYAERSGMNNRDASSAATATKFQVFEAAPLRGGLLTCCGCWVVLLRHVPGYTVLWYHGMTVPTAAAVPDCGASLI